MYRTLRRSAELLANMMGRPTTARNGHGLNADNGLRTIRDPSVADDFYSSGFSLIALPKPQVADVTSVACKSTDARALAGEWDGRAFFRGWMRWRFLVGKPP